MPRRRAGAGDAGLRLALSDADIARIAAYLRRTRTELPPWPDLEKKVAAIRRQTTAHNETMSGGVIMTTFHINGRAVTVEADDDTPLLWVIRDEIGLTGTKFGCGIGMCGACTVHVDGRPTRSCITPLGAVAGAEVTTIEGLDPAGPASAADRPGSSCRSRNAATASPARSCRRPRCSRTSRLRPTRTSTR